MSLDTLLTLIKIDSLVLVFSFVGGLFCAVAGASENEEGLAGFGIGLFVVSFLCVTNVAILATIFANSGGK